MKTLIILLVISNILILAMDVWILLRYNDSKRSHENEYYTDYKHGNLVLRIYKPEFEFQAIGNLERGKILDRGNFSMFYVWALIEM